MKLTAVGICLWVASGCLSTGVWARDISAEGLIRLYRRGDVPAAAYLEGLGDGIRGSNAYSEIFHLDKLYCVPPSQTLGDSQLAAILEKYLVYNPDVAKGPAYTVLIMAVMLNFPCSKGK